jgi:raffinose/stachyose/melibiose transport system substrate-binding protein
MKKFLTLALVILTMVSVFAGCGTAMAQDPGSGTPAEAAATTTAAVPVSTQTPAEAVTVKYMTWDYSDRTKSTDAWIQALKDKYNITVDMQNVPTDQYAAVFKTHFVANDMPDLVKVHGIGSDLMVSNEKVQLKEDSFADISGISSIAGYIPSVLDSVKVNGKLYYVPISTNVLGVLYNKKVFTDNGITVPTNADEFNAACDKLKAAKITPVASGAKDAWSTQIIPFIAFGQYIDGKDDTIRNKLADGSMKYADISADVTKVLNVQQDFAKKGYFQDNYLGTDINVASQLVGTGKAAMLICGTWQVKTIQDADPNGQVGFFALPLNAAGEKIQVPTNANEGICINASSSVLDSAKQALDYFLSPENQALIMADLNGISTNTQVKPEAAFLQDVAAAMANGNVQPVWWGCNGLYYPGSTSFKIDMQIQSLMASGTTTDKFISDFDSANAKTLGK